MHLPLLDVANRYSVPTRRADAVALIADPELDAVFILTPDHLHAELLEKAIRSGKPRLYRETGLPDFGAA